MSLNFSDIFVCVCIYIYIYTTVISDLADLKEDCFKIKCNNRLSRLLSGKVSACQCSRHKRLGFSPWIGKMPWRRKWHPDPVFLPGKFHRQKPLAACSSWGLTGSATTEQLSTHTLLLIIKPWFKNFKVSQMWKATDRSNSRRLAPHHPSKYSLEVIYNYDCLIKYFLLIRYLLPSSWHSRGWK